MDQVNAIVRPSTHQIEASSTTTNDRNTIASVSSTVAGKKPTKRMTCTCLKYCQGSKSVCPSTYYNHRLIREEENKSSKVSHTTSSIYPPAQSTPHIEPNHTTSSIYLPPQSTPCIDPEGTTSSIYLPVQSTPHIHPNGNFLLLPIMPSAHVTSTNGRYNFKRHHISQQEDGEYNQEKVDPSNCYFPPLLEGDQETRAANTVEEVESEEDGSEGDMQEIERPCCAASASWLPCRQCFISYLGFFFFVLVPIQAIVLSFHQVD